MRVCLLGASFETNNMGVSALAASTIACILRSAPQAELSLLEYSQEGRMIPGPDGQGSVRLVNIRFSKNFWLLNNITRLIAEAAVARLIPIRRWREAFIARNPWLQHVYEADLVVAISGGDSFADIYGLARFLYVSLPQVLALVLGRRLVLLPQTLGPFKSRTARAGARFIIRRAERVYSRDAKGVEVVRELLGARAGPDKVRLAYDMAFTLEPVAPSGAEGARMGADEGPVVGLNVSGLLFMGGYNRNNMFGLRADYRSLVYRLIEFLIEQKRATVLLVPHVFGSGDECDSPVCERLISALQGKYGERLRVVDRRYNQSEIKYIIGQTDFFVGSRMHACIAAVSECVPAVSIAYSDKFAGVMDTIGLGALVADPRKMDENAILSLVSRAYDARAVHRQRLQVVMPEVKASVLGLFSDILDFATSSCDSSLVGRPLELPT